jgi:hypothetical protein
MIRGYDDGAGLRPVDCAMTEWWTRLHCGPFRRHHSPPDIKRNFSQSDDNANVWQMRELPLEMRLARMNFIWSWLVVRWRAPYRRSDIRVSQCEPIIDRLRGRNTREAVAMHRGHQKVAGTAATIAGEYPARAVRTVGCRRKPKNQNSGVRIAKPGNRLGPVGIVAERRAFDPRNVSAVRAKARAFVARNDVVMNVAE